MMQTDVYNVSLTSTGALFTTRQRIRQITFVGNATAGSIIIYDNPSAASGHIVWSINFHTSNVPCSIDIPGEGILCYNGAWAVLSNVVGLSVCYG